MRWARCSGADARKRSTAPGSGRRRGSVLRSLPPATACSCLDLVAHRPRAKQASAGDGFQGAVRAWWSVDRTRSWSKPSSTPPPLPHEQRPQETVHAVEARQVPQALAAKRLERAADVAQAVAGRRAAHRLRVPGRHKAQGRVVPAGPHPPVTGLAARDLSGPGDLRSRHGPAGIFRWDRYPLADFPRLKEYLAAGYDDRGRGSCPHLPAPRLRRDGAFGCGTFGARRWPPF